jgi:hypothetical protein
MQSGRGKAHHSEKSASFTINVASRQPRRWYRGRSYKIIWKGAVKIRIGAFIDSAVSEQR